MSRFDMAGLFWDDTPPPKVLKPEPPKRLPPPRTWEEPDYLPYLEEALRFPVQLLLPEDLNEAYAAREAFVCDCEVYSNYFLVAFASIRTGKVLYFEALGENGFLDEMARARLKWVLDNFTIVTFNGNLFDLPIIALALAGHCCASLKHATNQIIQMNVKPWMILRSCKIKKIKCDHIDLIEVAPLQASLKIYGGRLHVPRMQELPFKNDLVLNSNQIAIVRWYCIGSDLPATAFLYMELRPQIELRTSMSAMYGVDLRSKSDAQIAEAVLNAEFQRLTYQEAVRPEVDPNFTFKYQVPDYIQYATPALNFALATVAGATFKLSEAGSPELPEEVNALKIPIADGIYQMGIGGLHSSEKCVARYTDDLYFLADRDVTSYYPSIILNQKLYPKHLGPAFLEVYQSLVDRRKLAKKEKRKVEADTLKIVVNGSFGKTGSPWSTLYAPELMTQVTMTGQLTLLMLVERLELAGITVCSANTDGILVRCLHSRKAEYEAIIAQWEKDTCFETEETLYRAVFARDVNNYIAVKMDSTYKVKGTYSERGSAGDSTLSKNPESLICADAVLAFLCHGADISSTIRSCKDIRRFITVRTCQGGAVRDGQYLGKAIRYYYAADLGGEIIYAKNGHKVPNSDGARPCMELPRELPRDIDFVKYEQDAFAILREIAYPLVEPVAV